MPCANDQMTNVKRLRLFIKIHVIHVSKQIIE